MANETTPDLSQADRIRAFMLKHYVEPARDAGEGQFSVRAGDIHQEMHLANAVPAVCSVLGGRKFLDDAGVKLIAREGPEQSTTTAYTFAFVPSAHFKDFTVAAAEQVLRARYGAPDVDTDKMVSFTLSDGRAVALQRDIARVQLWFEDEKALGTPPVQQLQTYQAEKPRHSNLPGRLKHQPPADLQQAGFPKPVISARATNLAELNGLLTWYDGVQVEGINRAALERFKALFLARYPDFPELTFAADHGSYYDDERGYKDRLIAAAREAIASNQAAADVGGALLDILTGRESGLLGWRTDSRIRSIRETNPGLLETAAGELAASGQAPAQAIGEFVTASWPALLDGQEKNQPFSESRNIPSMLLALARPDAAFGINTSPLIRVSEAVLGKPLLSNSALSADEYSRVLEFAQAIFGVMRDDWEWAPRDLWDVQGFIWAVTRTDTISSASTPSAIQPDERKAMPPTNLILYGPPGTGKTYRTAYEAVQLCDGTAPDDRTELMERYAALKGAGQIDFVTFHQSYAYEDFVEGLRPQTATDDAGGSSAGFRLEPRNGIFREICALAEQARRSPAGGSAFDLEGRQFFKMSLGRAGQEDHVFDAAIEGDYVVLGWGGEFDWSDPKYREYDEVYDRWNEIEPNTKGNSGNISQVWRFRGSMREGDIVIISEGNSRFRAIGEIVGDYEYAPTGFETYNHRRAVRWLLVLEDALPVETIYDDQFTMASCYLLKPNKVKREALARLLPGSEGTAITGVPDQFVLIIDEINRANISKVFGELITLIEPDKRLGEANPLEVKLPYSGDTFGVPQNLHIIGTMNTADRSIALLDTALRRRFHFRELMPEPARLPENVDGIALRAVLQCINDRVEFLFDRDHQIGHAFFMGCASKAQIDDVMRNKVIPLLVEYFYENWERVRQVLGETQDEGAFIRRSQIKPPPGSDADYTQERFRYEVQSEFSLAGYSQLIG